MKNSGARASVLWGLGAAALMLTSIACGGSDGGTFASGEYTFYIDNVVATK
jgi:hypothetical protein